MKVIKAKAMGMCFGVKDALEMVEEVQHPSSVSIYGELVHNEEIISHLSHKGFQSIPELQREEIPSSPDVLITAHGISDREKHRLRESGKRLIDTTCPLVNYVHGSAMKLQKDGYFIVVIGKATHVEVVGITGDLEQYAVVQSPEEVSSYPAEKIGIICQSTTQPSQAKEIRIEIEKKNPGKEIKFVDTICKPTKDRQHAAHELLRQVEALVVVGGRHSNNTKQLVKLAEERNIPVRHVQRAADLNEGWFKPYRTVGLTAGTSTPDWVIHEVYETLSLMNEPILAFLPVIYPASLRHVLRRILTGEGARWKAKPSTY